MFPDIRRQFGLHQLVRKRSATGIKWLEAREAGKHTKEQYGSLETKTYQVQNAGVQSTEVENSGVECRAEIQLGQ